MRTATYRLLTGATRAFPRKAESVPAELPRDAVGFLDAQGRFRSAAPWLTMDSCPGCKHSEVFVFSRCDQGIATYIAMETGHAKEIAAVARRLGAMIHAASS